eukprot:3790658-Pyramimonas_sp.AAC.2
MGEQLLYPTWTECMPEDNECAATLPADDRLAEALNRVKLAKLLDIEGGLDAKGEKRGRVSVVLSAHPCRYWHRRTRKMK